METPLVPNAFLKVGTDGSVIVLVGYSDMGQGVLTAVPQLVAEELDVEWERVRVEQAPAGEAYFNPAFGLQGTGGSTTVRSAWQPMREAGARARAMLIAAAAAEWGVPATECSTEAGFVAHRASGKRRSYGEFAASAATMTAPAQVTLKDAKNFRIIGKAVPRLDLPDKVTGRAQFGIDARPPGVLVAVIARCPTYGGKPIRWNDAAAKAVAGARHVVPISSGVAVVGDGYWAAHKGREALEVEWDLGRLAALDTAAIRRRLEDLLERPGIVVRREGRGDLGRATRRIEAVYEVPYLSPQGAREESR